MKLQKIVKQTNNKFLNMYTATYLGDKEYNYFFCSRRANNIQNVNICDAVKVLPYLKETDEIIFIKNFRYAVNSYIYEMPAGLVDPNENLETATKRELSEETGAEVVSLTPITGIGHTSAGLTDETIKLYFAEVSLTGKQHLDEFENINVVKVKVNNVINFMQENLCDVITELMVKLFLAEQKR